MLTMKPTFTCIEKDLLAGCLERWGKCTNVFLHAMVVLKYRVLFILISQEVWQFLHEECPVEAFPTALDVHLLMYLNTIQNVFGGTFGFAEEWSRSSFEGLQQLLSFFSS